MALRARLSPPRVEREIWPWHQAKWGEFPASLLSSGDRRMEGETFLASGYGLRCAMEARKTGWDRMQEFARTWQPSRLKGILVDQEYGTPFLAATQVFDIRPMPRKWLAISRIKQPKELFVTSGTILVTRSGSVGRATLAHTPHLNTIISDDLLRIEPRDPNLWGWLYAYLRSPHARAMMRAAQYGHIIKHLEVSHLDALPVPLLRDDLLADFNKNVSIILSLRIQAQNEYIQAEKTYRSAFPSFQENSTSLFFEARSCEFYSPRIRLDAHCFNDTYKFISRAFNQDAIRVDDLSSVIDKIFVPGRFKHIYGDGGMPYLDSADILEVSPDITKYVLSLSDDKQSNYKVDKGSILMPCSGQLYGNIGQVVLATSWHESKLLSNHIMRISPCVEKIHPGYLQCVLGDPILGRPLVIRYAFGSSVPELAPEDIATIQIPRIDPGQEHDIGELMEHAAQHRREADEAEEECALLAETILDRFIAGDTHEVALLNPHR